ncbi:MAG: ORF6N domain-containing protein [Coriobacteriales bacterium]|nr:ORF6N domain-containing protein [Coriobacteriales bacterium]
MQVLLDSDVARLYGYETKYINRAASRNRDRFPPEFRFRLTQDEVEQILRRQTGTLNDSDGASLSRFQDGTLKSGRGSNIKYLPYAYSEHGISCGDGATVPFSI